MEDFEYKVENKIEEYFRENIFKEDYCPHCDKHSRMIKVFDCTDRWFRCLSCFGIVYNVNMPIFLDKVPRYSESLTSKEVQKYADFLKAREDKEIAEDEENRKVR
jgi:hypothetical protein